MLPVEMEDEAKKFLTESLEKAKKDVVYRRFLIETFSEPEILLQKDLTEFFFNQRSYLRITNNVDPEPYKFIEKLKIVPEPKIKNLDKMEGPQTINKDSNRHAELHNSRVYLMLNALLKYYKATDLEQLKNKRIACISNCDKLPNVLFPYGNLFINQARTDDINDDMRIVNLYKTLFNIIFNKKYGPNKKKDCNCKITDILNKTCTCYQSKGLCQHLKDFKPEVLLLPHSIYYLDTQFIQEALDLGITIIGTAHIFDSFSEGSVVEKRDGTRVITWTNNNNFIKFKSEDDKKYEHYNILNFLYYTNNYQKDDVLYKINQEIIYRDMKHISFTILSRKGGKFINMLDKNQLIKNFNISRKINNYILMTSSSIVKAIEDSPSNDLILVQSKDDEKDQYLVRNISGTIEITPFRTRELSLFNILKDKLIGQDRKNILDKYFESGYNKLKMESQMGCLQIETKLMNQIVRNALQIDPSEFNEKTVNSFIARTVQTCGDKISNVLSFQLILNEVLKDVFKLRLLVLDVVGSNIVKSIKELRTEDKFSFKEKFFDFIGVTKTINVDKNLNIIKNQKEKENNSKPSFQKIKINPEENKANQKIMNKIRKINYNNVSRIDPKDGYIKDIKEKIEERDMIKNKGDLTEDTFITEMIDQNDVKCRNAPLNNRKISLNNDLNLYNDMQDKNAILKRDYCTLISLIPLLSDKIKFKYDGDNFEVNINRIKMYLQENYPKNDLVRICIQPNYLEPNLTLFEGLLQEMGIDYGIKFKYRKKLFTRDELQHRYNFIIYKKHIEFENPCTPVLEQDLDDTAFDFYKNKFNL